MPDRGQPSREVLRLLGLGAGCCAQRSPVCREKGPPRLGAENTTIKYLTRELSERQEATEQSLHSVGGRPLPVPTRPWLLPHGRDDKRNTQWDGPQATPAQRLRPLRRESRSEEVQAWSRPGGPCGPQGAWMPALVGGGWPRRRAHLGTSGRQRPLGTYVPSATRGSVTSHAPPDPTDGARWAGGGGFRRPSACQSRQLQAGWTAHLLPSEARSPV